MSSSGNMPVSCSSSAVRIPQNVNNIPSIQVLSSTLGNSDAMSTSPKRLRPFPKKQFYKPYVENSSTGKNPNVTPSPLSSSPDTRSDSPVRLNSVHPLNLVQSNRSGAGTGKQSFIGFHPVPRGTGSAGDSSDEHSGDSEIETLSGSENLAREAFYQRLHPALRANLEKASQARRHSWIW